MYKHVMCQGLWKCSQPRSSLIASEFLTESRQRLSKISALAQATYRVCREAKTLRRDDVDVFGLYSAKDLVALPKTQLLLAIIGDQCAELQATARGERQVVDSSLENLHDDATRKYVLPLRPTAIESNLFWPQREKNTVAGRGRSHLHRECHAAFHSAMDHVRAFVDDLRLDDIGLPDECGHEPRCGLVIDLVDGPDLFDPAATHDRDAIAHRESLLLVMGDEDEGDPEALLELLELEAHLGPEFCVQRTQRLVEQEDLGFTDDGTCQRDTLPLAAGELRRFAIGEFLQRGHLNDSIDAALDIGGDQLLHSQAERNVFVDGEVREERVALKDLIHAAAVWRLVGDILAGDENLPGGRMFKAADQAQTGCLPAAGRPQKRHEFTFGNTEADFLKRRKAAELLTDLAQLHH